MSAQFFFGVPLRARATAQNWERVCSLFQMCLRSVIRQSDANFRVLVACHDAPAIPELSDSRIRVLQLDTEVPTTFGQQMYDKGRKARAVRAAMREMGGGYLMSLDADDLVSNKLVEFVRTDQHPHGYLINDGYEYDFNADRVRIAPHFNRVCGSSGIFKFTPDELPKTADDEGAYVSDKFQNHTLWTDTAIALGRPLKTLPFRGAMYITNNGENHSALSGNIGWRRALLRKLTPTWRPSKAMREEFALEARAAARL